MRVDTYVCDRCNGKFDSSDRGCEELHIRGSDRKIDLCKECSTSFGRWLFLRAERPDHPTEAAP